MLEHGFNLFPGSRCVDSVESRRPNACGNVFSSPSLTICCLPAWKEVKIDPLGARFARDLVKSRAKQPSGASRIVLQQLGAVPWE